MVTRWWKTAVFYQLYVRSFCDSNGDGIGDIVGIIEKIDYFLDLGVTALWLTPIYPSPNVDYGYDVANYYDVDTDYGTLEDFRRLVTIAHEKGLKIIIDLVVNHTSNQHPWFASSQSARDDLKRDWYIWRTGNSGPPNNWQTMMDNGSAWTLDDSTQQYYYHAFSAQQVDLNWANPDVRTAVVEIVRFWLALGVDGFRLDAINHLGKDPGFRDNPTDGDGQQTHMFDRDQPATWDYLQELRQVVAQYPDRLLLGEVDTQDVTRIAQYLAGDCLDLVLNFNLGNIAEYAPNQIFRALCELEAASPFDAFPTLYFSNHDQSRHFTRFGRNLGLLERRSRAEVVAAILLTAKGVPILYYGEEFGVEDVTISDPSQIRDIVGRMAYHNGRKESFSIADALLVANARGRDKARGMMPWADHNLIHHPLWMARSPIPLGTPSVQLNQEHSLFHHYRSLIQLRKKSPALSLGSYVFFESIGNTLVFIRRHDDDIMLVCINLSRDPSLVDPRILPPWVHLETAVLRFSNHPSPPLDGSTLTLYGYHAIALSLAP